MVKRKFKFGILVFAFIFTFFVSAVPAQEATVQAQVTQLQDKTEETAPGNVSMDFKNADIRNVLRILSYKSGINIVAGPEVSGLVTIRLTDVPWEKALDVVLRTYGFAYERVGNIIRVTTIESLKEEELTTEVFTLNYSNAEELVTGIKVDEREDEEERTKKDWSGSLNEMLTGRGKISYDKRTNTVIVTDIPTNLYKISQIIKKLDQRTPQVMIESKIIETSLADDERMGIDWSLKVAARGAQKPMTFPFARFAEQQIEEDLMRFFPIGQAAGTVTGAVGGVSGGSTTQADFPATGGPEQLPVFPFVDTDQFTFGTLDFTTFQAVLEYLDRRTDTEILSNPKITTLNNQEASILVGQIIGIPLYERNSETGQMEITGYEEREVGIMLNVTPHINTQGDISVDLKPVISELLRYDTLDASRGVVAPVFSTREAETEVMMRDGETLMIGGLIRKTVAEYENKVPILGDIPILGKMFFTKKEDDIDRTEIIIFLTVHLVQEKWVPPAGSAAVFVPMPAPRDAEIKDAVPKVAEKPEKKTWWQRW